MDKNLEDDLIPGSHKDQTCCHCVPIEKGMKAIGYFMVLEGIVLIWLSVRSFFSVYLFIGGITIMATAMPLFYCYLWFEWLRANNGFGERWARPDNQVFAINRLA